MNYKVLMMGVDFLIINIINLILFLFFSKTMNNKVILLDILSINMVLLTLYIVNMYYFRRLPLWIDIKESIKGVFTGFIVTACFSLIITLNIKYLAIVYAILLVFLPFSRYMIKKMLFSAGIGVENLIIIGYSSSGINALKGFVDDQNLGYRVVGFLSDEKADLGAVFTHKKKEYRVLGNVDLVFSDSMKKKFSNVVFIDRAVDDQKYESLLCKLQTSFKKVIVVPNMTHIAMYNTELYYLFKDEVFYMRVVNSLYSPFKQRLRRLLNYIVTLFGIVLISPILLLLICLVKFSSPGPIIFAHSRVGKDGRMFKCYKFRTMYMDAQERLAEILANDEAARKEWEGSYKLKNDPRVTGIGSFLRKSSLDELPQLFNVLKGEMSLVGPRPVVLDELEKYYCEDAKFYKMVDPGITGLWQVSGRSDTDYDYRVGLDKWYVINWTFWLDIVIIFKTFYVVFKRQGAY